MSVLIKVYPMKGPNPFAMLEPDIERLSGRKDESRIFNGLLSSTTGGQGGLLVVRGGPGSGKSTLLEAFKENAEKNGVLAPYARAERGEDVRSVSGKAYQDALLLAGSPGKAGGGRGPRTLPDLIRETGLLAAKRHFGAIIFIDDMDNMRKADENLAAAVRQLQKAKASLVVSSTRGLRVELPDSVRVLELRPLDAHDAGEMVEKALRNGPKMGEECMHSMMSDTQGNPRLLRSVCRLVYDRLRDNERIISKGHYLAYMPYIMSMLSREWFGRMYQETPPAERAILHALASGDEDGMHVSDIAKKTKRPLGPTTALMKRLLDRGQVVRPGRGKYVLFARLYAKYISQRTG